MGFDTTLHMALLSRGNSSTWKGTQEAGRTPSIPFTVRQSQRVPSSDAAGSPHP